MSNTTSEHCLINNDVCNTVCGLGQEEPVGASTLIPYKTQLKVSAKVPDSFSCDAFWAAQ